MTVPSPVEMQGQLCTSIAAEKVAVVVPTLDEAANIGALLTHLLTGLGELSTIVVVDGGSSDGTQVIAKQIAERDSRVTLLHNPARLQAAGINLAVQTLGDQFTTFVRIDAHASYPAHFVPRVAECLRRTGADSVVVRLETQGERCFQRAVAAVSNSVFGTGGAAHRVGGKSRWIDHGHHAAFKRATFEALGGYDTTLAANEDAEYDMRLRLAQGKIWFESSLDITYHPRRTVAALARQYYRYGKGRASNFLKHRRGLRLRQLAPPLILAANLVGLVLAPLNVLTLVFPGCYLAIVSSATAFLVVKTRAACAAGALIALPTMHFSWAVGFLQGLATVRKKVRS